MRIDDLMFVGFFKFDSFTLSLLTDSGALTAAIDYTGDAYNDIGEMFEKQVSLPLDSLHLVMNALL